MTNTNLLVDVKYSTATPENINELLYGIIELYYKETGRVINRKGLELDLLKYPNIIAEYNGEIVGFATTNDFSPDILRLDNLYVRTEWRNEGLGSEIMKRLEDSIPNEYKTIIADNSLLYEYYRKDIPPKRFADTFYTRIGYKIVIQTEHTFVFKKDIHK
jgi:GNAT superfamily N-acetyltransferase